MKVLISDNLHAKGVAIFEAAPNIEVINRPGMAPEEFMEVVQDVEGLVIRSATKVTDKVLEVATKLKVVGRAGTGLDNVNIPEATKRGVVVMNTPGGNTVTTGEHAISMMLALARNIPQAAHSMREGRWEKKRFGGREVYNKTLGIIGLGRIGTVVASRAQGLKMRILGYDPYVKREMVTSCGVEVVSLDELFERADFITLHLPKTAESAHIINREAFKKMKHGVMIINCARGGLIDEDALKDALDEGMVAGAALDVFEKEPPVGSPLLLMGNVICTPHLGASTEEAQENVAVAVAEQMVDYLLNGTVKNAVNAPSVSGEVLNQLGPFLTLAEALGSFQSQIAQGPIDSVKIEYIGEISKLDTTPLLHSIMKGLLYPIMRDEVNFVNAPAIAKDRGIHLTETKVESAEDFTTQLRLTVRSGQNENLLAGTVFGRFEPRLVRINSFRLEAIPQGHMLFIYNSDKPGVIGAIGSTIGKHSINIARMTVGQEKDRGQNIILLTTDTPVTPECLADVRALPQVASAIPLEL
jgi:D-3-phosphoglycerate dehydrogenase / 2-oxoglutarate reductase